MPKTILKVPIYIVITHERSVSQDFVKEVVYKAFDSVMETDMVFDELCDSVTASINVDRIQMFTDADLINKALKDV